MRKPPTCIACRKAHAGKCAVRKKRKPISFIERVRAIQRELLERRAI